MSRIPASRKSASARPTRVEDEAKAMAAVACSLHDVSVVFMMTIQMSDLISTGGGRKRLGDDGPKLLYNHSLAPLVPLTRHSRTTLVLLSHYS